jgi:hypothetical protein
MQDQQSKTQEAAAIRSDVGLGIPVIDASTYRSFLGVENDMIAQNNRRNNHVLEFRGRKQSVSQWRKELGLPVNLIDRRLLKGWSVEKALTQPVRRWPSPK